jgi:hypothetical protein
MKEKSHDERGNVKKQTQGRRKPFGMNAEEQAILERIANEEYFDDIQKVNPLADWIAERQRWPAQSFGGESQALTNGDDISELSVDAILEKFL